MQLCSQKLCFWLISCMCLHLYHSNNCEVPFRESELAATWKMSLFNCFDKRSETFCKCGISSRHQTLSHP